MQLGDSALHTKLAVGYYAALSMSAVILVSFAIAVLTPPISGEFCTQGCIAYPYLDAGARFPRDYYWMYPAMLGTLLYLAFVVSLHALAPPSRAIFSLLGVVLASMSAVLLVGDYFLQVTVIQPSLTRGEADGISLLTQYNPHGIFIALEELGYLLMSLSLLCIAPVLTGASLLERIVRWLFVAGWVGSVIALAWVSLTRGVDRGYLFEIAVVTIDWLVLVVSGSLMAAVFRRSLAKGPAVGSHLPQL